MKFTRTEIKAENNPDSRIILIGNKNTTIIEATSGNTGISLAYFSKEFGYKVNIIMPNSVSIQRKDQIIFPIKQNTQFKIGDIVSIVCPNNNIKQVIDFLTSDK